MMQKTPARWGLSGTYNLITLAAQGPARPPQHRTPPSDLYAKI